MRQNVYMLLIVTALTMSGCEHKTVSKSNEPRLEIEVQAVRADSILMNYEFTTHLKSGYDAVIQPRVSGYLQRSYIKSGEPVKRGDLLFVIDANLLNTTMRAAQADLLSAQAKESEAKNNYERALPLASQGAISQTQMDEYKTTFAAARQAVQSARQQLENARLQVGYTRIYAPISGIVAATSAHEGDYVGAGTQFSTLTTISNMDTLKAEISIPTSLYLRYASVGRASYDNRDLLSDIRLYLDDGVEYEQRGVYDYTQQNISPTAGTITLVVKFPNPDSYLKAGEYARIRAGMGRKQLVVLAPQKSVERVQGVSYVWIIDKDSTAHYRRVEVGESYGSQFVITSGLQAGEMVALMGSQKLREGMKVTPIIKE